MAKTGMLGIIGNAFRGVGNAWRAFRTNSSVAMDREQIDEDYSVAQFEGHGIGIVCIYSANQMTVCYRKGPYGLEPI